MSRIARKPLPLPKGVELKQAGGALLVKGPKGELSMPLNHEVEVKIDEGQASVASLVLVPWYRYTNYGNALAVHGEAQMRSVSEGVRHIFRIRDLASGQRQSAEK